MGSTFIANYVIKKYTKVQGKLGILNLIRDHGYNMQQNKGGHLQGRRRRSGWSGLSRTNNLELNQLADQFELHYSHAIFGRSHLHVATYILQMLLKMHDTSSYLVSQPN